MSVAAVSVQGLSKTYRVYATPWNRVREHLLRQARHRAVHALSDVSFELPAGEALGIVGENGAGKSTLLKILASITVPTGGTSRVQGRVSSILELGSGFHPEFSGRQNIVLNAAMLGLTEAEVREKTPEIIAFSELGEFIDQPLKCYSTGMAMRLGFSIAMQVDPDVVIIDEALSVGDGYFQKKCLDRLQAFLASGKTLLFCSHAMYYVSALCHRALWLREGKVAALGPVREVVGDYERFLMAKSEPGAEAEPTAPRPAGPSRITSVHLLGAESELATFGHGEPWCLEVEWETSEPGLSFHLGVGLNRRDGVEVTSFSTHREGLPPMRGRRRYRARLRVPALPLVKGEFTIYVFLLDETGLHIFDQQVVSRAFLVESASYVFGLVEVEHSWDLEQGQPSDLPSVTAEVHS
jgi:ABC-type polysaccharide/polyol phosphate transport system ATPase subunit